MSPGRSIQTIELRCAILTLCRQLAVVRGLVRERTQQLGSARSAPQEVFKTRKCRNSYGVVVSVPYDASRHLGLPTTKKPNSDALWVPNIIE